MKAVVNPLEYDTFSLKRGSQRLLSAGFIYWMMWLFSDLNLRVVIQFTERNWAWNFVLHCTPPVLKLFIQLIMEIGLSGVQFGLLAYKWLTKLDDHEARVWFVKLKYDYQLYYIHFEITGYPCNVIGSQQCDLFPNRTILCSKSHLFLTQEEWDSKTKQTIWFQD